MVAEFEELSLDQEITNKLAGQSGYPSPQFEDAWFKNFDDIVNSFSDVNEKLDSMLSPFTTTTELNDITDPINTTFKGPSKFNTVTGAPVFPIGSLAADVWVDATGATVNTPV